MNISYVLSPLVAKVPVEVHPPAQTQSERVPCPVLPPQPVRGVGVLITIRVHHRQDEEVVLVEHVVVPLVGHQVSYDEGHRGRAYPLPCMYTFIQNI